ncbi:MAG: ABC transporter permease [Chloroflexota bacterium]|nr:ABC transporter permease [Chloroflexota bacterium]
MGSADRAEVLVPVGVGRRLRGAVGTRSSVAVAVLAVVLLAWQAIRTFDLAPELFVPGPADVFQAFLRFLVDPYQNSVLLVHLGVTLARVLGAFLLALLTGVALGIAAGLWAPVDAGSRPVLNFIRPLPPLAYYALLLIWLGFGEPSKIALLYLAALPPLVINTRAGVLNVRQEFIGAARSLGASQTQVFRYVVLPASLPFIFTGARIALGFTYTTVVAAELLATTTGIGYVTLIASEQLRSDIIFVGIIVMGITGMLLDWLAERAERRIVPWIGKG